MPKIASNSLVRPMNSAYTYPIFQTTSKSSAPQDRCRF
jgi:hypothetical protein